MTNNKLIRYAIYAGLWGVLIIPFYVAANMFFPFISGKNFAFRIIIEIVFALWAYLAYVEPKYRPKKSPILVAILAFALVMLVADIFAVNPAKAFWSNYERMDGFVTLLHMLMYFTVFGSMMKTEKIWLSFFRWCLASPFVVIVYEYIYRFLIGGNPAIAFVAPIQAEIANHTARWSGPLGNPIYLAVFAMFLLFFTLILFYKDVIVARVNGGSAKAMFNYWRSYVYAGLLFLFGFIIWKTQTRGVLLGLIGGLIVASIGVAFFETKERFMKKTAIGTLVVIAVLVGGFLALRQSSFVKQSAMLNRLAEISWNDVQGQGQARQYVWPMALKGIAEKPILGWGQDGFNYVFNKYYDPRMYAQEQWFDRAHDTPLDVAVAGGLLGLIAYLSIFVAALVVVWRRRTALGITDAALVVGLLAGYFFQNIFVFDNLTSYMFFYMVLAYLHSRDTEYAVSEAEKNKNRQVVTANPEMANYVVAPIAVVLLIICLWILNIRPLSANLVLIQAIQGQQAGPTKNLEYFNDALSYNSFGSPEVREQLLSITPRIVTAQNADNQVKQDFVNLAFAEIQKQLASTPKDARYQLFAGSFFDSIGNYELAIPYLQQALVLSPKKQTMMMELARSLAYLGRYDDAVNIASTAYNLETDFTDAKDVYIATLILDGKQNVVRQLFGNATSQNGMIVQSLMIRASEALKKGDKAAAIAYLQKATMLVPGFTSQANGLIADIQSGKIK